MTRPLFAPSPARRPQAAWRALAVPALALTLVACGTPAALKRELVAARQSVGAAGAHPHAAPHAELELQRARQALARAEALARDHDADAAAHWAYLARQRAAVVTARADQAQDEERLRNASVERERVRLEARTREAEAVRQQAQASVAQARQQSQQANANAAQANASAADANARAAQLEADLQALQARKTDRGMVVTLGDVLFDTGRAELKAGALRQVQRLAQVLQQHTERRVLVEGFTDNVGSEASNLALSQRRAEAFALALVRYGVPRERIDTQAHGEAYPVASNDSAAGRQRNRRVEVLFSDAQGGFTAR